MIGGLALQIDWGWTSVVVALCALAATRQLPEGTLQATRRWPRMFGSSWRVAPPVRLVGRWHLVALPLLFTECVLLAPLVDHAADPAASPASGPAADLAANSAPLAVADTNVPLAVAHLVGFTSFLLVALLLPIAVASHGLVGLIFAVCVLANSTLIASMTLAWVEWRLRAAHPAPGSAAHGDPARGFRIRLQSPFSIPYAAASVLDHVLAPLGAATAARRLMPDVGLYEWLRPHLHDHLLGTPRDDTPAVITDIVAGLGADHVTAAMARPGRCLPDERYCPRCGSCYETTSNACADCPGAPALA